MNMDKITYGLRKSKGLCPLCETPVDDGHSYCADCRRMRRNKANARVMQGLCVQCANPTREGKQLCDVCGLAQADAKKRQRALRKEQGLCSRCGKTVTKGTVCDDCKQYAKDVRKMYASYGLCTRCHKNHVYGNDKTCSECRVNTSLVNAKYREAHRDEINKRGRELYKIHYEERKAKGICTRCGKNKASKGKFTCTKCREKNNQQKRLSYVKILVDKPNRCRYCNNDSAPGYKVCEEHRQKLSTSATSRNVNEARKKTRARLNW